MKEDFPYRRDYSGARKFRCVDRATMFIETVEESVGRQFENAGISRERFGKYWSLLTRSRPNRSSPQIAITENFGYWFTHTTSLYRPGRFNTDKFPALYTAKETQTAICERLHYAIGATKDFEYVVYSIYVTGDAIDLRPLEDAGKFHIEEDHLPCQNAADVIRHLSKGVVWFSFRKKGGACCAFFSCDEVKAGEIVEEGTFPAGR
jgi:hypothetical protein